MPQNSLRLAALPSKNIKNAVTLGHIHITSVFIVFVKMKKQEFVFIPFF